MKSAVLVLSLALCGSAMGLLRTEKAKAWNLWTRQYGKTYSDIEGFYRYQVFAKNMEMIAAHNAKNAGFTMAANEFADLTPEEFNARFVGGFRSQPRRGNFNLDLLRTSSVDLPSSVDWSQKGAVTPIKNQGQCGSCWAFSTTGSVEGINEINGKGLHSLSEQQLVDCSGAEGNQGCNGGLMDSAFEYIIKNGGLCSEASYPYKARDGTCDTSCSPVTQIKSYTDVPHNDAQAFKEAIAQQPVSIAIEADQSSFQFYSGGVLTANCGTQLDHGVLAVGYGTMSGTEYYKVKNSWGASWGMSGYILLAAGSSYNNGAGQCGILSQPSWPSQ
jgi:C1A family cysteine protease